MTTASQNLVNWAKREMKAHSRFRAQRDGAHYLLSDSFGLYRAPLSTAKSLPLLHVVTDEPATIEDNTVTHGGKDLRPFWRDWSALPGEPMLLSNEVVELGVADVRVLAGPGEKQTIVDRAHLAKIGANYSELADYRYEAIHTAPDMPEVYAVRVRDRLGDVVAVVMPMTSNTGGTGKEVQKPEPATQTA